MMDAKKILITEDEILIAREIEITLQDLGYTVTGIARNGRDAIEQIAKTRPDLVLMDIVMPGDLDGIETANLVRMQFHLPIVFLTAYADADTLRRAKITEPFGYVLKPFQSHELDVAIQVALVRHQSEKLKLETLRSSISNALPHEISTPLHGILGFTDLLLRYYDTMSSTEVLETLHCIRADATRLEQVCQNVLLYTRLEVMATDPAQIAKLRQETTASTPEIIQRVAEESARACHRSSDLKLELQDLPAQIAEVHLQKVVKELVDNALRFSEPGTSVKVSNYSKKQHFCLSISDCGIGMTDQQISNVGAYTQFMRQVTEQPGIGMGLALTHKLVSLYQGEISIKSAVDHLDHGTTVVVRLPQLTSAAL